MKIRNIAIIGFGKFGQALSSVILDPWRYETRKNPLFNLSVWDVSNDRRDALNKTVRDKNYYEALKHLLFFNFGIVPRQIRACATEEEAIKDADLVIIATPSFTVRETARRIKNYIGKDALVLCGSKGAEAVEHSGKLKLNTMYDVLEEELPENKKAIISGPNLAAEIILGQPTETVIASEEKYGKEFLNLICSAFSVKRFKAAPSFDVLGIELCAFFKHLPVIASGIVEKQSELELGKAGCAFNSKGAIIAKAIDEIKQIAVKIMLDRTALAKFDSVAWIGDIICSASPTGRNYQFGQKLGEGKTAEQAIKEVGETVEGPATVEIAYKLMQQYKLELPLIKALYGIIFENKPANVEF